MLFFRNSERTDWTDLQRSRCSNYLGNQDKLTICDNANKCISDNSKSVLYDNNTTDDSSGLTCPECNKRFAMKRYLTNHLNYVHKRKSLSRASCKECSKSFSRKDTLKSHINRVHRGIVKYHQCDICGDKFKGRMNVDNHKNAVHLNKFNLHCELCGKGFLYESGLNTHKKQVHDKEITLLPCPEKGCLKIFKTKGSLKYHIDAAHATEGLKLVCDQCGKIFTHPYLYKKHLRDHRNGPLMYSCNICDKTVTTLGSYKDHMRTHTGERPFICELCGTGFHSMKHLKGHRVVHTKERPYRCNVCEKRFSQRSALRIHLQKSHSQVKEDRP